MSSPNPIAAAIGSSIRIGSRRTPAALTALSSPVRSTGLAVAGIEITSRDRRPTGTVASCRAADSSAPAAPMSFTTPRAIAAGPSPRSRVVRSTTTGSHGVPTRTNAVPRSTEAPTVGRRRNSVNVMAAQACLPRPARRPPARRARDATCAWRRGYRWLGSDARLRRAVRSRVTVRFPRTLTSEFGVEADDMGRDRSVAVRPAVGTPPRERSVMSVRRRPPTFVDRIPLVPLTIQ